MSEQEAQEAPRPSDRPARKRAAAKSARRPSTSTSRSKSAAKASASSPAESSADDRPPADRTPEHSPEDDDGAARRPHRGSGPVPPLKLAAMAAQQLELLTGREHESITGLERTEDGWVVSVEVLELRRIPATTDVLATYQVDTDDQGDLQGYRRTVRYVRGSAGGDRE